MEFDATDRALINALQESCRRTAAELAETLGLTLPTCHRRLQKIRESGVLTREVALVDPAHSPKPLTVIIEVTLERITDPARRAFAAKVRAVGEIMQCFAVSGAADFLLIAQVADINDYYEFVNQHFVNDEAIRHFKTAFALNRLKFETAIPF